MLEEGATPTRSGAAGRLAEGIRAVGVAVSGEEVFDRLSTERNSTTIQEKLKHSEPLLNSGAMQISNAAADRAFALLLRVFREHLAERMEDWEKLERGVHGGEIGARALLEATLAHRWDVLRDWARGLSLDLDALQFFSLYLARPFREQAAQRLWEETLAAVWQEGYCPVCGHSPVLGRLSGASAQRRLWCCGCNTSWPFLRIGCPFCANESQERLGYLSAAELASYRVYVCDRCRRYLKTSVAAEDAGPEGWDWDREHFATVALDAVALRDGFIAEPVWLAYHGKCEVGSVR